MKKIAILLAALLFGATLLRAQAPAAEMTFGHTEHDFGTIGEKGGEVSHTYPLTNTGKAPLVITGVETSCGCTTAKYDKKPIPPGATSQIVVTYNPKRQGGVFYKAIQVFSNDPQNRKIIVAKGEVVKGK